MSRRALDYLAVPIFCSEMFTNYADLCFQLFGDSVKLWTTFNEPQESAIQVHAAFSPYHATALTKSFKFDEKVYYVFQGYGTGGMAPGRCSNRANCAFGNSSVEPYIVGHNILKAHAAAVQLYKSKYQVIKLWVRRWSDWGDQLKGGGMPYTEFRMQAVQQGRIGITLDSQYFYSVDTSQVNTTAANRGMEFSFGW